MPRFQREYGVGSWRERGIGDFGAGFSGANDDDDDDDDDDQGDQGDDQGD